MWEFGKIQSTFEKASTNRAENIFPKYLSYDVHEIARKYPRQKKYSSGFYDSVVYIKPKKTIREISVSFLRQKTPQERFLRI